MGPSLVALILVLSLVIPVHEALAQSPARAPADDGKVTFALVRDGFNPYIEKFSSLVFSYLSELAGKKYSIASKTFNGDNTPAGIQEQLRRALRDPHVEIVIGAGMIVTQLAARLHSQERNKPVFGAFPQLSELEEGLVTEQGTSAVPNFTFAATPDRVESDLRMLRKLTKVETIHGIIDSGLVALFDDWEEELAEMQRKVGAKLILHGVETRATQALSSLPKDVKTVYVGILPRFSEAELRYLFTAMVNRGIFSLAMSGQHAIDLGAAAALATDLRDPLARRSAVNLHQLALGFETGDLQVYLPNEDQLVINLAVTEGIGWSADYETYLSADFVNGFARGQGLPLTLEEAMDIAAEKNPDAAAARAGQAVSQADTRIARSALMPQLSLNGQHNIQRIKDPINFVPGALAPERQHAGSYGLQLRQILFDDSVWSNFRAQRRVLDSKRLDALSSELDARALGGTAFLQTVLAEVLHEISAENLRLTESNLRLARLRVEIGTADPSEIYRWESEVARGRANLAGNQAMVDNSRVELDRVLNAPADADWAPTRIELKEGDFYFMGRHLGSLITDYAAVRRLDKFMRTVAMENSPELASFDQNLEAQGILLSQKQRIYFLPNVNLQASYARGVQGIETQEALGQDEWTAGLDVSLPLFQGGRRYADTARQKALIEQLRQQRQSALQSIQQRTAKALNNMGADHANILLSRRAVAAAQKNYDSVRQKYSLGAATILDLLDAQSGRLLQRQQEASATYNYLIDVVSLQRAIAWFEATKDEDEKRQLLGRLEVFLGSTPSGEPEKEGQ